MNYVEKKACRMDGSFLETILDFGEIYPSNFIDKNDERIKVPLILCKGMGSNLVQLKHTIDRDSLYRNYWYKSGLNKSMVESLKDVVIRTQHRTKIFEGDVIVDIGANDGTMLTMFPNHGVTVGFDPAENLKDIASSRCDHFINDYFTADKYPLKKKAKIITSIAMFYDLDDPHTFIQDVKSILDNYGIWVVQLTDLLSMLRVNAFDNIVHEHLEYYSLEVLINLMKLHRLQVWDVSYNRVNGGSIRAYISHADKRISKHRVKLALKDEKEYMESFDDPFIDFKKRVEEIKHKVVNFIRQERERGKTIYGLGASTKGNTTLQYFGLGPDDIIAIGEINKDKFGLKTIGTNIPIIPEEDVLSKEPDYIFILPWHFIGTFVKNNREYLNNGGSFIVPCPRPAIIVREGKKWI